MKRRNFVWSGLLASALALIPARLRGIAVTPLPMIPEPIGERIFYDSQQYVTDVILHTVIRSPGGQYSRQTYSFTSPISLLPGDGVEVRIVRNNAPVFVAGYRA